MCLCVCVCLFVCVLRPFYSEVIWRRHPHLLSLAKDVTLGKYTVPTGNRYKQDELVLEHVLVKRNIHIGRTAL